MEVSLVPGSRWGPDGRFKILHANIFGCSDEADSTYIAADKKNVGDGEWVMLRLVDSLNYRKFIRELSSLRLLQDQGHAPTLCDQGEWGGCHWYTMGDYFTHTLCPWDKRLKSHDAPHILIPVASVLQYAHRIGVAHGNVSHKNICLDVLEDGTYYVFLNDWTYRPEADARDDQYTLAAVGAKILLNVSWDDDRDLRHLLVGRTFSGLSRGVKNAYCRALSPEREDRFPTIGEFIECGVLPMAPRHFQEWWSTSRGEP